MRALFTRLATLLGRWPIALAVVALLAIVVLLPGLAATGFWEPQERQLVDRIAPRDKLAAQRAADEAKAKTAAVAARAAAVEQAKKAGKPLPPPAEETCPKQAPEDTVARTLTTRVPALGRDLVDDSDAGRRLPIALMGILTVLAAAGIAMRTLGARAGIVTAIVLLSFPLLVLQSRMITTEIGTACGATLIVYGLVALGRGRGALGIVEAVVALAALAGGCVLGFVGGGLLLGAIVPIGAFAAAGALGVPVVRSIIHRDRAAIVEDVKALLATLLAIGAIALLAYSIYELRRPYPGMLPPGRSIVGHVVAPTGCWSTLLGGLWKPEDDLRIIYDSTFEQIAYGTFPWGILAPIAMAGLLRAPDARHRRLGVLALAWAGAAWIAGEVFQRKVGFTVFAGFPPMAIAIGGWLDLVMTRPSTDGASEPPPIGPMLLIATFVGLAVLDLGKDLQSFTEHLTSILVGSDAIAYPTQSRLAFLPTRVWILLLGLAVAIAFAIAIVAKRRSKLAARATAAMLAATVIVAAFWSYAWLPALGVNLSSKTMFDTWQDLHHAGDQLVVMGDLGDAPFDYADSKFEKVDARDQIVAALGRPNRVFAIAPQTELCTLHREIGGKPYYVLDDRNTRSILLSNKLDGAEDHNPLATAIVHTEPKAIPQRPKGAVIWDKKIQLLGWDIPKTVSRGAKFDVVLYYKIIAPVGGTWTTLMHFDGPVRFSGDHKPINDRCPTSTWQPGDYIVDTFTVTAGGATFAPGPYELWIGFFTGTSPNFKNMTVTDAPADMRDPVDRVKIMSVTLD